MHNQVLKPKGLADTTLIQREYHNRNKFDILFERNTEFDFYVKSAGKSLGPAFAVCKADDFLYLPHGFYKMNGVGVPDGTPMHVLMNLEKAMFKGNKIPSNHYGLNE